MSRVLAETVFRCSSGMGAIRSPTCPSARPQSPQAQAPLSDAAQAWDRIVELKSIAGFEAFREQYGANAVYDTLAALKLEELKWDQAASSQASSSTQERPAGGPNGLGYLSQFPTRGASFLRVCKDASAESASTASFAVASEALNPDKSGWPTPAPTNAPC
jgi:hypothetical protein